MGVQLPSKPITRKEKYLAKAAGQAVEVPAEPITREEAYLNAIAHGGGGGGTSDYNHLENQPQINGNTLVGNKTASELGLADSDTVGGILNGTNINSFGDVETALEGKQDALTAGDYISIDDHNNISVNRELTPHQTSYRIKGIGQYTMNITKYIDGVQESSTDYGYSQGTTRTIDDAFTINDTYSGTDGYIWQFVWLKDSTTHDKDYTVSYRAYNAAFDFTEVFNDEDLSGYKLVIKSELDAALALKQDKTDNALQTTDKTVVGAVNELKSGLTNLTNDVKLNTQDLTTPSRTRNLVPLTLDNLKAQNTLGTWIGNAYEYNGIVWTINTNSEGQVTSITGNGTANGMSLIELWAPYKAGSYIINGAPADTPASGSYYLQFYANHVVDKKERGSGVTATLASDATVVVRPIVPDTIQLSNVTFYPMVRFATESDATYTPYIPSVESRIEAVESGVAGLTTTFKVEGSATDLSLWANDNGVVVLSTYIAAIDKRVGFKRAADGTISSYESD